MNPLFEERIQFPPKHDPSFPYREAQHTLQLAQHRDAVSLASLPDLA